MKVLNYIGGEFQESKSNQWINNYNPATNNVIGTITKSTNEDVELAISAAKNALAGWKALTIKERASYLFQLSTKIKENIDELALIETRDTGKPIHTSTNIDIPRSAKNLEFFADFATNQGQETFHGEGLENYVLRSPLGVVGCISPWNLPLYLFTWKIAPALISGNTVIAKPSEFTPSTAFMLSRYCQEIKLPPGVLNVVHGLGPEVGSAIVNHTEVKAISFTGSSRVGKIIANSCGQRMKKVSLELGGKNPFVITENADIDKAVSAAMRAAFTNQGQVCLCGSRIYIHKSLYENVKIKMIEKLKALKSANPELPGTRFGSLTSKEHFNKVKHYENMAKEDSSITVHQYESQMKEGNFISPMLLENVGVNHPINQDEIFGPIATIQPYESEDEVVALSNNTQYGLCASIFTKDREQATRLASKIDTGIVWVNTWLARDLRTPFGGVKASGFGREGGNYALNFFTEPKNICFPEDN
ncbi:MAG: 2-hydroxymuconic semialdehyde dehydrogenase [Halobacteriovoraceae bacterium]|nr:2-hydroxymuconic semialdehyde dehydrogenase [Halobacteriovoraceae bacterium]